MSAGLSLAAAAAELGIHRQRVYEWVDRYPEFADTVKLAMAKRQLFLERRLLSADVGPVVTSTIFALKNAGAEDWRDKQELEHKGQVSLTPVINLNGNAG
ncbi:helix-turn-helix domain-containing protein [Rhizobium lentis]|uniref:Helix-turn-helix domain-containing protein n=2 Tax=Rhizobium lentis TaxID=1138194 RepID=A0ABS7IE09_9HYPH|nr:helix-turn-helix domain-containing protein [Rhizobium lentis]